MLSARDIRKSHQGRCILAGISIDLVPGSISALLGPSGGGKTTFLRTLCGLSVPDSGTVSLDNRGVYSKEGSRQIWPEVTVVFQQQFLWPHLTVRQNISLVSRTRNNPDIGSKVLLERLECDHVINNYPWQLSQGERARVALARALSLAPRVLLLDEVTAALDTQRAETVGTLIREHACEGVAILLVTHELVFASRWADAFYRLEGGKLSKDTLATESESRDQLVA